MSDFLVDGLLRASAGEQLDALARGTLSAVELLALTRDAVDRVNPVINAIVSTDFESAQRAAAASDARRARGLAARPLEGLPVAVKDLQDTAGLRTTYGSLRHADHVPSRDALVVSRLRHAGAVIYGKTNTPEFGTGSHTYNRVFGLTSNPYAGDRSAGGSSGGAAAALATGLTSVADGSDMGGSLRNPAAFCNVVGLRPSAGRVPNVAGDAWDTLATAGPMARTVGDTALLLSALAGPDTRSALALTEGFPARVPALAEPLRIGWSRTVGGLDIEPEVTRVLDEDGRPALLSLGHSVVDVEPRLEDADDVFRTFRALLYAREFSGALREERDLLGAELITNTEDGLRITVEQVQTAFARRERVFASMMSLFDDIDVLAAPVTSVLPFPVSTTWPREINGIEQTDYLQWMRPCWRITVTGFVALSVPCGFSEDGLPVGLQLIAPPRQEALLLALAQQFETARPVWRQAPPVHRRAVAGVREDPRGTR